jgi:fido (protein-threonine AMPylation protein)
LVAQTAALELISVRTLRLMHQILFAAFVPLDYYAGNFRQNDAARPCLGIDVGVGAIAGANFHLVSAKVDQLVSGLGVGLGQIEVRWTVLSGPERARQLAVLAGTAIGEFIRIHPFINGNGRVSRLLWRWFLNRFSVPAQIRIEPRPAGQYEAIMAASMQGDDGPLALEILRHLLQHPPKV